MGMLEEGAKRERRWGAFQTAMLYAALGGLMVATGAVPDFRKILKYYAGGKKDARFNYRAKTVLGRLVAKGLIRFEERDGKRYARLTETGKRVLDLELLKNEGMRKPKRWDNHWRVVIFDIPERRRKVRVSLRFFMGKYGFVRLQDSVWIYPYDCEELITLAKAQFRIGVDVLYMIVERLENDAPLREQFNLPTST
jgi:hypothetical protein